MFTIKQSKTKDNLPQQGFNNLGSFVSLYGKDLNQSLKSVNTNHVFEFSSLWHLSKS